METITMGVVGITAVALSALFFYLGLRSYRRPQTMNPRTYKRGRL